MLKLVTIIFAFISCIPLCAQPHKILPNTFYKDGETLNFRLRYGIIIGGTVTLSVRETSNLYHVKGVATTTGLADKLFSVKDIYESYIDKKTSLPVLAIQNVKEGRNYKYYNEVKYNRSNNTVVSTKSGQKDVPEQTLDMMSVFYFIRQMDFSAAKPGDSFFINTFFSDKLFPFELRFRGREMASTPLGNIMCLKFAPVVEPGRVFKTKDDMYIWFSDDSNRIPVLVSMEMLVGHVICEITSFSNTISSPVFTK